MRTGRRACFLAIVVALLQVVPAAEKSADGPEEALQRLRTSLEQGNAQVSTALREPAYARLRQDPAWRPELRELLAAYARESDVEMVAADERGKRMLLELDVVDRDSGEPLAGRRIYLYHADELGYYAGPGEPGANADNPRLFAFLRTDPRGHAAIRSVVPGAYGHGVRHVHMAIDRGSGAEFETTIHFAPDEPPSKELREEAEREGANVVRLEPDGKASRARARIRVPRD
jgi:hypothetical protein